jgi:hypothetical protein
MTRSRYTEWEAWLPGFQLISKPQPEFAKHLEAGTEDTANDVSSQAYLRHLEYETTTKGVWRKGWAAEGVPMLEDITSPSTAVAKVTSPTTGEVSFNSLAC